VRHRWLGPRTLLQAVAALVLATGAATAAPPPQQLVTLDAEDTYLPSVLKILAEKGNLNIITGPGVTSGKLSIHMKDVPIDQAVNLVVRAAGLAYERIGNSILVADAKSLRDETGLSSYVIELKYADALEVKAALKSLTDQIQVDPGGNRLIIVTSPRVISEIEEVVRAMDVPVQQVMLEARIVEVSTDDTKRLGVDWDLLTHQGTIIVEGNPGTSEPDALPEQLGYVKAGDRPLLYRQQHAFQAQLDLLISEGHARLLANPKIATLNGRPASMLIGTRIPFLVTGVISSGGGAAQSQLVEREEVGIKLSITPIINTDGFITTVIQPEVSSVIGYKGPGDELPVVSARRATTTVRLRDGSSVIIGGLLSEEKTTSVSKLPILGQIPVLGLLFQHHVVGSTKKDLVIEVTPHIMAEGR
jgi:type IV pilus secretin PilQ/predicted competence protein